MKRTFYIVSSLCLISAIGFGLANRKIRQTTAKQALLAQKEKQQLTARLLELEESRELLATEFDNLTDQKLHSSAGLEETERELSLIQKSIETHSEDVESLELQSRELDLAFEKLFQDGPRQTIEQLSASRNAYTNSLSAAQGQVSNLHEEIKYLQNKKQNEMEKVGAEEVHQLERMKKIALGQMHGSVIAINSEWGFALINAGSNHGVAPGSAFLVMRDKRRVCRLSIVQLRPGTAICKVAGKQEDIGLIRPGDTVIVEEAM